MKRKRGWLLVPLVILALLLCAIPAYADIPTIPHAFYGTITIDDVDAAVGTVVTAKVAEVECGSITTTVTGQYGGSGAFDEKLSVSGDIETGATISFHVTGSVADQTSTFSAGGVTELDLTFPPSTDTTAPTVEITSTASDPTNTSPIPMTATFSETVTGFVVGDITVGNGAAGNFVAVSGTVYTFDVTPAADGAVTVDIAAGVAQDVAGNPNEAATQFSITYDSTAPTATVSPEAGAIGVAIDAAVTATFGEDVLEGALGDITITGATGVSATLSEATDTITIAHDDFALGTSYTVTIPAGAVDDLAGNPSAEISWSFTTEGVIPGDANGDGFVNALDITKVERIVAGLDAETPGADANQDGNINSLDITKTERIAAGLD